MNLVHIRDRRASAETAHSLIFAIITLDNERSNIKLTSSVRASQTRSSWQCHSGRNESEQQLLKKQSVILFGFAGEKERPKSVYKQC